MWLAAIALVLGFVAIVWLTIHMGSEEGGGGGGGGAGTGMWGTGFRANGSEPEMPLSMHSDDSDCRGSYQRQTCAELCTSQLAACGQACENMPLCDQRTTCRQGCAFNVRQCRRDCPDE